MYPSYRFAALFPINLNRGKTSLFFWPVMEWTSWLVSPKSVQENVLWPCEEERGDNWREGDRFVGLSARWRSVRPAPSGVLISSTKGSQVDRMTSQIPPVVKLFSESESDPSRQNTKHAWLLTGKSVFRPSSTCWKDCKHFPLRRNINFHERVRSISRLKSWEREGKLLLGAGTGNHQVHPTFVFHLDASLQDSASSRKGLEPARSRGEEGPWTSMYKNTLAQLKLCNAVLASTVSLE